MIVSAAISSPVFLMGATAASAGSNVSAQGNQGAGDVVRDDIQWMPPGPHEIVPSINGKPTPITVTVDQALAQLMISDFERLRSEYLAGTGDEPFIDFAHRNQDAAGHPTELYWAGTDAKAGGIRARVVWTKAARAALEDKQFTRFSPQWQVDTKTGAPIGLFPNMGGLVNHAAFSTIQRVRAGATSGSETQDTPMTPEQIQAAVTAAMAPALSGITGRLQALETAQAAAGASTTGAAAASAGTDPALLARIDALERQNNGNQAAHADRVIAGAVQAGRLAPQDAASATFWRGAILAQGPAAEAQLNALPVNPAFVRLVQAGASGGAAGAGATAAAAASGTDTPEAFVNICRAKVTAGASRSVALASATKEAPKAYAAWRDTDGKIGLWA
jgi:phage I-like protein